MRCASRHTTQVTPLPPGRGPHAPTPLLALPLLAAAVALPLPGALAAPAGRAPAAARDFYAPPAPLPHGKPGAVVRSRSVVPQLGTGAPATKAWTVMYHSRDTAGRDIPVTGTVLVPEAAWTGTGPRPVVGFAVGTQGPGPQCAPSKQLATGNDYETSNIDQALRKGWAVAVTDYEGYTTGSRATYVVGRSEGHAVLDAVRAARDLPAAGIAPAAPVLLWGYSQGGGASAWATVLQPSYAPELRLVADASGGVPADSRAVGDSLNGNVGAAFLLYSVSGFGAAYPSQFPIEQHLNATGKQVLADVNTQCVTDSLGRYAFQDVSQYLKPGETTATFQAIPSVAKVLEANTLTTKSLLPEVPVFQYHGLGDEVVPLGQAMTLHSTWCAKGVTTVFQGFPGEHLTTNAQASGVAVQFLADRLAGTPVTGSCAL